MSAAEHVTKRPRVNGDDEASHRLITGLARVVASDESRDVKGKAVPVVIEADAAMTVDAVDQWVVDNQPAIEKLMKVLHPLSTRPRCTCTHAHTHACTHAHSLFCQFV
jgi:hypothetical protein